MSEFLDPSAGTAEQESELRQLRQTLAEATAQVEQLRQRKSGVLAMAVHDLRTPLAIIQGYLQLLAADLAASADPAILNYIDNIMAHADSLGKMVENLMALDHFEWGAVRLSPERSDLNELVDYAIAQVEGLAKLKNLSIDYQAAPVPAWVNVDREQLRRALYNVLSHVIKYARPDAQLRIDVTQKGAFYHVQFLDPHRHLATGVVSKLFDVTDMGHEGVSSLRGMDMGLVLTRHIIERHDGRVAASSKKERGVTIDIYLPAGKAK